MYRMRYFTALFEPKHAEIWNNEDVKIACFPQSKESEANNKEIGPGDRFVCYMTEKSRIIGILEAESKPFISNDKLSNDEKTEYPLRFKVKPIVWNKVGISIKDEIIWNNLNATKNKTKLTEINKIRSNLPQWELKDGQFLESLLLTIKTFS